MSAISGKRDKDKLAMFNTTIDKEVFDTFKYLCKSQGLQMSTVVEAFMKMFNTGDIEISLRQKKCTANFAEDEE